jgi:hypothetical protein
VDIETATDRCVFRANAHRYVCSANADPDTDTHPSHHGPRKVLEALRDYDALHPLVLPGFQPISSRRLSRSPPSLHGCLSIPSFANALSLPILQSMYNNVMNR